MNTKFDSILHLKKFVQQNWSTNRKKTKVTLGYLSKIDNSSETIIFISEYYFQLQYYKDAINIANRGLQIKTSAELYMRFSILIGRCYEAMKKYSTAEAFYDKVIILRLSFVRKFKNLTYRMCKNIIIAYFLKARILLKVSFGIDVDKVDVKTVFCTPTQTDYFNHICDTFDKSSMFAIHQSKSRVPSYLEIAKIIFSRSTFFLQLNY